MKTAFTYHRYSHDDQKKGHTLDTQRAITKNLAEKYETSIIGIYEDEAISGATIEKRPGMISLLEDLEKIKPDYLIATDQDRISRSNDFWVIKTRLAKTKTSLITEKEGILDQADITKDAMSDMINVFAKLERAMIGKRIKRVFDERRSKGQYIGGTPTGYRRVEGKLVVYEPEANLIKNIFERIINNESTSKIVGEYKKSGIKMMFGGNLYPGQITRLIAHPVYIGKMRFNGEIINADHEAIIDEDTYFKANKTLEMRRMKTRTRPAKYLLTGLLKCANCGKNMNGIHKHYRYKENFHHGYRCKGLIFGECWNAISGHIEELIFDLLHIRILKLKIELKDGLKNYKKEVKKDKFDPENIKRSIESKMERWGEAFSGKVISLEYYRQKISELNNQLNQVQQDIKNKPATNDMVNEAYEYLDHADFTTTFDDLDFTAKRNLLLKFVDKILVSPSKGQGVRDYKKRIEIIWKL